MTAPELDLTAAIDAVADVTNGDEHEFKVDGRDWLPRCVCGWSATEQYDVAAYDRHFATQAVEAALPFICEQLAQQIEQAASGPDTSCATDSVLHEAARIVRGDS